MKVVSTGVPNIWSKISFGNEPQALRGVWSFGCSGKLKTGQTFHSRTNLDLPRVFGVLARQETQLLGQILFDSFDKLGSRKRLLIRENPTHHNSDILQCISSPNSIPIFFSLFSNTAQFSTGKCCGTGQKERRYGVYGDYSNGGLAIGGFKGILLVALPAKSNGYLRVDCYGGLNQMRRDFCDGVGIARLLNALLFYPNLKLLHIGMNLELASKEPVRVDCSKRKGSFDYVETVLPSLLEHHYISITPAMSQRRDSTLEKKASELLQSIPKPFLSLHLRFEPDMVAYSQCEYSNLSPASVQAIEAARVDRKPWTGEQARLWRNRGKCPLTPNETALILQALSVPTNTNIYLAAGDGLMELEGLTSISVNVFTKSTLLTGEDFKNMHGNTKAALDYYVSINSDSYMATYFGNMDKMVAAMRAFKGCINALFE
ncbi:hypothetical protein DH2020_016484 [Rehmannia glutinosa]|uniref:O-fucosyltransferase family protein n=1 Tax=Rehmannia glutinosa TaxID=99300 RepID=A0ABR0WP89_REHGL